jgi:uncharacterized membrane protein (UPF0127 family)
MTYHPPSVTTVSFTRHGIAHPRAWVQASIAANERARVRGLLGRRTLGPHEGMLFTWATSAPPVMTMAGMLIPLDIFFIDDAMTIRAIAEAQPGQAQVLGPARTFLVLEAPAGFAKQHGIAIGDRIAMSYLQP